ncbi:S9 family peptidase [bacterium]|nr:S9 family peptidase [bacterium]
MPAKLNPILPEDLYKLRVFTELELSPDGRTLLTSISAINNKDENKKYSNLYVRPLGAGASLKQFTRGEFSDMRPRFSPDGKLIAFSSSRSGSMQLHLIPTDGGESWQLTKLKGSVGVFEWSPDSKSIVFTFTPKDAEAIEREEAGKKGKKAEREPAVRVIERYFYRLDGAGWRAQGSAELRVVDVSSGRDRVLVSDGKDNSSPCFSPDGKYVIFASNKSADPDFEAMKTELWKVPAGGGKVSRIPTFAGPSESPSVSPDGQWLAFRGWEDESKFWGEADTKLFVTPLSGKGGPRMLGADLDRAPENSCLNDTFGTPETAAPLWSRDGKTIYSMLTSDGSNEVWAFDVASGKGRPVFKQPGVVLAFAIDEERDLLYLAFADATNPGDIFVRKLSDIDAPLKQLSRIGESYVSGKSLGEVTETWARGEGGHKIQGWIMTPPGFNPRKKYPAVLYIHGGPHMAYSRAYMNEFNYLAGQGYVVFYCNPRGSTGYGEAHKAAISRAWGKNDYSDIMRFTDHVLRQCPFIDKERLGCAGGSYGGYMTAWIIGHTQRFKAAVVDRAVTNFMSFFGSSDFGYLFHREFGKESRSVWEERERFIEMSPISHMHKAKTPALVLFQDQDLRCPTEQSEQVYVQLKLKGVPTRMVRYPDEPHGMSRGGRTDRRIHRLKEIKGWMDKYVQGKK